MQAATQLSSLAGPIVGATIALVGVALTNIVTHFREKDRFRRDKWWKLYDDRRRDIERTHEELDELRRVYGEAANRAMAAIDRGEFVDIPFPAYRPSKLSMLVSLYHPELEGRLTMLGAKAIMLDAHMSDGVWQASRPQSGNSAEQRASNKFKIAEASMRFDHEVKETIEILATSWRALRDEGAAMLENKREPWTRAIKNKLQKRLK